MYAWIDKTCKHKNVLTDYGEGTNVCTDCGLVINDQIFSSYNYAKPMNRCVPDINDDYWIGILHPIFLEGVNVMKDVCEKFNISSDVCAYAINLLKDKCSTLKPSTLHSTLAVCFYKSSKFYKVERSFNEICCMFQIQPKAFNNCFSFEKSKSHDSFIDDLKPSQILNRIQIEPILSFRNIMKIGEAADSIYEKVNSCPNTVLAYVIYDFFLNFGPKKKLSMGKVAKMCNVSTTSIKRLVKVQRNNKKL